MTFTRRVFNAFNYISAAVTTTDVRLHRRDVVTRALQNDVFVNNLQRPLGNFASVITTRKGPRREELHNSINNIGPLHLSGRTALNNENFPTKTSPRKALIANEEREIKLMILMRPGPGEHFENVAPFFSFSIR